MQEVLVAIEIDGEISTGEVIEGQAEEGETVTIKLRDENGMTLNQVGVVVAVL